MNRLACRITWLALMLLAAARASFAVPPPEGQGTYLGALFGPVTEALRDQLPQLPRQQGVIVTQILPESPAAAADLRRHDILLSYDGQKLRDCEHLARLIHDDKPGRKLNVTLLRAGKEASVAVTLASGPALKLATTQASTADARAANKPGAPASVNVCATALDDGRLRVTIEYCRKGSDKVQAVTWEGDPADLDGAARDLPERERQLARHALDRLRTLNAPGKSPERRPPS